MSDAGYSRTQSHVKVMNSPRANEHVVQAAADHLRQLSQLMEYMSDADLQRLQQTHPGVASIRSLQPAPASQLRLPHIPSALPSPRRNHMPQRAAVPQKRKPPAPPRGSPRVRVPAPSAACGSYDEGDAYGYGFGEPAAAAGGGVPGPPSGAPPPGQPPQRSNVPQYTSYEHADEAGAYQEEEVQAVKLASAALLRMQPIELLLERRKQALEGLQTLLHSLNRVRHSSHRIPPHIATAYQARLQYIIGWYRVTATELVERINWYREHESNVKPKLKQACGSSPSPLKRCSGRRRSRHALRASAPAVHDQRHPLLPARPHTVARYAHCRPRPRVSRL